MSEQQQSSTVQQGQELVDAALRSKAEKEALRPTQLVLDSSNEVSFPGFPYTFEALGEQILVSIDLFKSGYECKVCNGKGRLQHRCKCTDGDRPGFRYNSLELETIIAAMGEVVGQGRREQVCNECGGVPESVEQDVTCSECKGNGAKIILLEESKNLMNTGVVVSMGAKARELCTEYKVGDRILFSTHSGSMIPTKAGLMFKRMDWYQAWVKIRNADELGAFDFIVTDND